jgi:NitT/TauT family transport system permease protein
MAQQKIQTGRTGRVGAKLLRMLTPVAGILVFLAIWQAGVMLSGVPAYLLPAPTEIAQTFVDELPRLLRHGWVTTYEMLLGYLLAVAIAIPLAIAITSSQRFDEFVMPTMLFFQVVPKVAVAPLFLVWFGVGALPKILVAFLISFFPIVIDAAVGLRSMSSEMTDLARSMGDAGHCGRGRGRICGRRQGLGLSAAGDEFEHGDRLDVCHSCWIDVHRPSFLLLG